MTRPSDPTADLAASVPPPHVPVMSRITSVIEVNLDQLVAEEGWIRFGNADAIRVNIGGDPWLTAAQQHALDRLAWRAPHVQVVSRNAQNLPFVVESMRKQARIAYEQELRQIEEAAALAAEVFDPGPSVIDVRLPGDPRSAGEA